ncbi:MAG TPA: hypothetical protein QGH10_07125, partial [Armatimonadota bacterium]|nr:hypothetical protein [Armatimonadota bacterium]
LAGGLAYTMVGSGSTLFVNDGFQYYCYLPSLALDRDLDFTNEYEIGRADNSGGAESEFTAIVPETGRPGNAWAVGPAILWAPFFLVGLLSEWLTGDVTGFSMWCQWPAYMGSLFWGVLGAWILYRKVLADYGQLTRLLVVTVALVATNISYYLFFAGHMSHSLSFFAVTLHIYCLRELLTKPADLRWWAFSGLSFGLVGLVRWQDVVIGVLTLAVAAKLLATAKPCRRALLGLVLGLVGTLPAVAIQALVFNSIYGKSFLIPQGDGWMVWTRPHVLEVLFSYPKGFFLNSPVLVFGVAGLIMAAAKDRVWSLASLLTVAVAVYVCAASTQWGSGESFGMRRLVAMLPVLAVGMCEAVRRLREGIWPKGLWAMGALGVAWNWALLAIYFVERIRHP